MRRAFLISRIRVEGLLESVDWVDWGILPPALLIVLDVGRRIVGLIYGAGNPDCGSVMRTWEFQLL